MYDIISITIGHIDMRFEYAWLAVRGIEKKSREGPEQYEIWRDIFGLSSCNPSLSGKLNRMDFFLKNNGIYLSKICRM